MTRWYVEVRDSWPPCPGTVTHGPYRDEVQARQAGERIISDGVAAGLRAEDFTLSLRRCDA